MTIVKVITPNKRLSPFQTIWDSFWFDRIPENATFQSFQVADDTSPGINITETWQLTVDVNYRASAYASDTTQNVYEDGSWNDRDSGTNLMLTFKIPDDFVLPDVDGGDTPNNPTIILNRSSGDSLCLNGACRPTAGGSIWGYLAGKTPSTHGGSWICGGELTLRELDSVINHAIAINIWASKYLSNDDTGYVAPAVHADTGYDDPESSNYYGGNLTNIKMGSRFGIPPTVAAEDLSISSTHGLALFAALQTYGAYVVDNTGWDAVAIGALEEASSALTSIATEIISLFAALELVI